VPAVTKGPAVTVLWRIHRFLLKVSRGRLFTRIGPGRQLLLITKGRKSGEPRPVGLTYIQDGERWIVVGSNAGDHQHPAWWLNLAADPLATVMVEGRTIPVIGEELEEPERTAFLNRFSSEIDSAYTEYQRRTTRRFPVVALSPAPL
jgi:deazaflavin-dependent oxidoreductase (nitroreductase family)